ncbi:MAG: tRNA preQ1(34) S-adenosylmethionine ribosyltransferase-isomerase QueA [Betaproteobacteria bacterium]|nr:tRNA preQ1(34) S-adenosylmethionine ribosyltransferase-isomerase QueA [Betaproteobacteria bacterium]
MLLNPKDFEFDLPNALIAQSPPPERGASRLLHVSGEHLSDRRFTDLPDLLREGDLLVFNDTRVIKARLQGAKVSGGRIEVLIERLIGEHEALAQVRASKAPRAGTKLRFDSGMAAEVLAREDDLYRLQFSGETALDVLLDRHGEVPLPPYVTHKPTPEDEARYQTVYARQPGAVAAPTAGLHFDRPMLAHLESRGVNLAWLTLHVGAGTFQPVRADHLEDHRMHPERYSIPEETRLAILKVKASGGRVIAVGTTSMRALESAVIEQSPAGFDIRGGEGETRLFILPGYPFRVVDRLITNFHLPRSTLLMLVSAFAGIVAIQRAYAHAIQNQYRFFSYGDAMLIESLAS